MSERQDRILNFLESKGDATVSHLANGLGYTVRSINKATKSMERRGEIVRVGALLRRMDERERLQSEKGLAENREEGCILD